MHPYYKVSIKLRINNHTNNTSKTFRCKSLIQIVKVFKENLLEKLLILYEKPEKGSPIFSKLDIIEEFQTRGIGPVTFKSIAINSNKDKSTIVCNCPDARRRGLDIQIHNLDRIDIITEEEFVLLSIGQKI